MKDRGKPKDKERKRKEGSRSWGRREERREGDKKEETWREGNRKRGEGREETGEEGMMVSFNFDITQNHLGRIIEELSRLH